MMMMMMMMLNTTKLNGSTMTNLHHYLSASLLTLFCSSLQPTVNIGLPNPYRNLPISYFSPSILICVAGHSTFRSS